MAKVTPETPIAPSVSLTLGDTEYKLCFDYSALALAEADMRKAGVQANVLMSLGDLNLTTIPILVAAAARKYQPKVTLAEVQAAINMGNVYAAANAIQEAWALSLPEHDKKGKGQPAK